MFEVFGNWYEDSKHGADDELLETFETREEAEAYSRQCNKPTVFYSYVKEPK
jgi:hypothetical protein